MVLGRLTHSSTQAARKLSEEDLKLLVAAKVKEAKEKAEGKPLLQRLRRKKAQAKAR